MLPPAIPIFPLPNVVLFPNVFLPLHIFEPRYRAMVGDAVTSDRMIGMVLLRPGWEQDYDGRPPVFPIGCSGLITHVEQLSDGRYNIVLRGFERFRIVGEDQNRPYRRAVVERLSERPMTGDDRAAVRQQRAKLEGMLAAAPDSRRPAPNIPREMGDEDLINALAQYLDLEPLEKQALLEHQCLRTRAESLVELLEIKIFMARTPGVSNVAH